ncbi:MAG: arylsulfatase [Planctomycetota bacterium]|nr:MAG: arylsulfatase [Planctomycetota bacterium]
MAGRRVNGVWLLLIGVVIWWSPARSAAENQSPHVVIILVDDMGFGDPPSFNPDSKIPMPHIDAIARGGMRFTDAHAPGPLCHLSRYGLMTGEYPFRANPGAWSRQPVIDAEDPTIASLARQVGYTTAMVGKWHLGFEERGYDKPMRGGPVDRGFDTFFGIRASTDIPPYFYIRGDRATHAPINHIEENHSPGWSPIQGAFWRAGGIAPDLKLEEVLPRFTDEAIAVIDRHASTGEDRPLLLYLALPAPHTPWLPSPEFKGRSGAGMYGDFAMMVDAQIGRVDRALARHGMVDNTLLIFTSDNGPVWYEQDVARFQHDSAGGLRGMKADAWEGGHRMPFIARWPNRIAAQSVSDHTICFTDIMATLCDIWQMPLPADAGEDSFSFYSVLTGTDPHPPRAPIVMEAGAKGTFMIRDGRWKLINQLGSGGFSQPKRVTPEPGDPPGQLYDLQTDRAERRNLYADHPQVVAELTRKMDSIRQAGRSR